MPVVSERHRRICSLRLSLKHRSHCFCCSGLPIVPWYMLVYFKCIDQLDGTSSCIILSSCVAKLQGRCGKCWEYWYCLFHSNFICERSLILGIFSLKEIEIFVITNETEEPYKKNSKQLSKAKEKRISKGVINKFTL